MTQKAANSQKVAEVPILFNRIGVNCPTMVSAIHITIILIAIARPLILFGNISAATTNFKGPIENAKHAKKASTNINNQMLVVAPAAKQIPVHNKLIAAPAVPVRYNGRRPALSTFQIAIRVNNILAAPNITWLINELLREDPALLNILGP